MYTLEYFKADGKRVESVHHTAKAAKLAAKRVGVDYAYITSPEGVRGKVRFNTLGDSINPATLEMPSRTERRPAPRGWKRK